MGGDNIAALCYKFIDATQVESLNGLRNKIATHASWLLDVFIDA